MGKSKKSTPKVDAVSAAVPEPTKSSTKNGKREAEVALEKVVNTKKQKVETDGVIVAKKVKPASKKSATPVKAPLSPNSDDSDNEFVPKKAALVKKNPPLTGPTVKTGKKDSSTDSDSSESESDKDMADQSKVNSQLKKPASGNVKNGSHSKVDTSTDESDSDADTSSEEEVDKQTVGIAKTSKKEESDDSSSSDSSDDEVDTKAAASGLLKAPMEVKKDESESESDSEEDDESDSDKKNAYGGALKPTTAENDGSTDSSDSDSDDEPSKEPPPNKAAGGKTSVKPNEEDTSDEDDSSEESSEDEKSNAQEAKQGKPKAPAKPQSQDSSSKILFVGNLSYSATPEDVENFFKAVADVQEVRLSKDQDGNLRGFGHVEFSSAEDARKALELNGQELFGRALKLDFTRERGSYTPQSKESNSFQRGVRAEGQTIFVRGFDISLGEEEIRSALQEHFGSCGEISRVSVPTDFTSGAVKGIAYLDFKDAGSLNSALELSGSDLGGYSLYVDQARPKGDVRAGGDWSGGRSGGRGSGRWSGGRSGGRGSGRGGARDSGGRFGGRRGGGRGGGRRGGRG